MSAYYFMPTVGQPRPAPGAIRQAAQATFGIGEFLKRFGGATLQIGLVSLYGGVASLILGIFGYSVFTAVGILIGVFGLLMLGAAMITQLLGALARALAF